MKTRSAIQVLLLGLALAAPTSWAAGGSDGGSGGGSSLSVEDPEYAAGVAAIQAGRFDQAIATLSAYVARVPNSADAENWLGYAYRRDGQLAAAFAHYDKALAIDPKHRGAHEYVGEAFLMAGKLDKAEEHLKILDRLCWLPCEAYSDLKRAVADYKAGRRPVSTAK